MRNVVSLILALILTLGLCLNIHPATRPDMDRFNNGKMTDKLIPRQPFRKPAPVDLSPNAEIERVIFKLIERSRGRLNGGMISSAGGKDLGAVNAAIKAYSRSEVARLMNKNPAVVEREKRRLEFHCGRQLPDMNNYFAIKVSSPAEAENLVDALNGCSEIEIAYAEPRPTFAGDIPPPTPDFSGSQDYLRPAPVGVDADYGRTVLGGDGTGIRIIDIEGSWKFDHEDLETAVDGLMGGIPYGSSDWRNHGTAVIGELIGGDNGYGVTGIVPNADIGMISINELGNTEAILLAVDSLRAGDIMLIELHSPGPRYNFEPREDQMGYVCLEYWPANFDAIQLAWAKGIIVVEAAGNGYEDFDDPIYEDRFDTAFKNSHAIICGAGAPPSENYGPDRSRLDFSNYGSRINLQGQGYEVVTTGFGGLFAGGSDERQFYTGTFGGTSGAAPIVAGSAAALQGIYKARHGGAVLDSDRMRDVLVATGSPQQLNPYQHIGPRPDIKAADSALPEPPLLIADPVYFDTTVQVGTQVSVFVDLYNSASDITVEFAATTEDSLAKDSMIAWITLPNPTGTLLPLSNQVFEIILDATALEDRSEWYKGMVEIAFGQQGNPLDQFRTIPIFLTVPCADTTYHAAASTEPEGPVFDWIDITSTGNEIPLYSWYNDFVEEEVIDDGTAGPFYIGFDFPFYDTSYKYVFVGANGGLSFTDTNVNVIGYYDAVPIPNPPFETFIAPFWNDLNLDPDFSGHGTVYFYRSPRRDTFIVEYFQAGSWGAVDDTLATFEVILSRNGNIKCQYLSVGSSGMEQSAVIGIAEYDCASVPYYVDGGPVERMVADSTAVLFDYAYIIWEMAGDANYDGDINVADAVYLINWIFKDGPAPYNLIEADANCDGIPNVADAVYLINYIFKSGPAPCLYEL